MLLYIYKYVWFSLLLLTCLSVCFDNLVRILWSNTLNIYVYIQGASRKRILSKSTSNSPHFHILPKTGNLFVSLCLLECFGKVLYENNKC